MNRKLTKHLLNLAENDDFQTTLHILLTTATTRSKQYLNLNKTTSSGDYIVTLSSYAACERALKLVDRIYALKCLWFIIHCDFTATNKVARDGGSALHCALVASLNYNDEYHDQDNDDDDEDDDNDDDESINSDDDESYDSDSDSGIDKVFIQELKSQVNPDLLESYQPEFTNLSSDEIIVITIFLLLYNDADVNLPLVNASNIFDDYDDDDGSIDDDDYDLAFSKEAITQQWTPLMFALQMVILATMKSLENTSNEYLLLGLPIMIIQLLLHFGADPTYIMASSTSVDGSDWNAMHILAASSYHLSQQNINTKVVEYIQHLHSCSRKHLDLDKSQNQSDFQFDINETMSVYNYLDQIMGRSANYNCILSPLQQFTVAIMTNNVNSAKFILETTSTSEGCKDEDIIANWRIKTYSSILPLSQIVYDNIQLFSTKTILNMASFCLASDSVQLLVANDFNLISEDEIKNSIICVFLNSNDESKDLTQNQLIIIQKLVGMNKDKDNQATNDDVLKKRQRVLDRLLIESCSKTAWAQRAMYSTLALLRLGADSNTNSIADKIHDKLSPLHLVAGNYRGSHGVEKVECLLGTIGSALSLTKKSVEQSKANLFALTQVTNVTPLEIALEKRNFYVVKSLYDAMCITKDMDKHCILDWNLERGMILGEAATECTSVELFRDAIDIMKQCSMKADEKDNIDKLGRSLGKLLVLALDERSAFGKKTLNGMIEACEKLKAIADLFCSIQDDVPGINIAAWARDEISGHTPLHLLLRNDRSAHLRSSLLRPVCTIMSKHGDSKFICLPCSNKFGSYTALHLACALGCEESVKTLLDFNADPTALSSENKKALDMIKKDVHFSGKTIQLLSTQ